MLPSIAALNVYPVKSLRGTSLSVATIDARGIVGDRGYMVVDALTGQFLTQRKVPRMARIRTDVEEEGLHITIPTREEILLPPEGFPGVVRDVEIWGAVHRAVEQPSDINHALSTFLGRSCALVRMEDAYVRPNRRGPGRTGFADGYSFQGHSRGSLRDLCVRAGRIVPEDRFRASIVLEGVDPYFEDHIVAMRVGDITFTGQTLCKRCNTTTTDQRTGKIDKEPLATFATYRKLGYDVVDPSERHLIDEEKAGKVVFGRNFTHEGAGTIYVGQEVEILDVAERVLANVA